MIGEAMDAVITAGGYGTRLLPATKEIPKEMLPVPFGGSFKPIMQIVFEQLFAKGVRDFVMVVGRGKRVIEDHFTPDYEFTKKLGGRKRAQAEELERFYSLIEQSDITWVNQLAKRGFGDAVMRAEHFVGNDLLVAAADHIPRELPDMPMHSILVTEASDPENYGVVLTDGSGGITAIEEKPHSPKGNVVAMPYYRFDRAIFGELHDVKPDASGEIQLTPAIQALIQKGTAFRAVRVLESYDLGTVEKYTDSYLRLVGGQRVSRPWP